MIATIPIGQFSGLRFKLLTTVVVTFLVLFVSQFTAARLLLLDSYSYLLSHDIVGRTAQSIYAQAQATYCYYFWTTLAIGLIFCGLSWLLLEKYILSRMEILSHAVSQIGITGDLSTRISLAGNDELSSLANLIDWALEQLQQSQKALTESEERYSLALQGSNNGMWDWDLLGDRIYFSERWKAILGYEGDEIDPVPESWLSRVNPQDRKLLEWGIDIHLNGETPYLQYEYQMQHKDGSYRWVLCRGVAVRDEKGVPYRMAGSLSDVTERKLAEQSLSRQTIELARSNAELEQFAYVASHDLQEPLRKIEAFGDRLKTKCANQLGEQGRDYLDRMQKAAGRMRTLIEDLMTFSRVATKAQPFATVDLNETIADVISDLEIRLQQTGGHIEVGELFAIDADPLQMRQLLQNLLSNALKFRRPDASPIVKVTGKILADGNCQIAIADNGIGFDQQYSDRIFQVFQRLHGRNEYEGTGIGLAVCAKIIARHCGTIAAESLPGQGATFIVTIPIKQASSDWVVNG